MFVCRGAVCLTVIALLTPSLAALGGLSGPTRAAADEAALPAGFVLTDTPTGQAPFDLTDFAYLPDGSALTTGKSGRVTWVPERGRPRTVARLVTDARSDVGLVGVGVAPDYSRTGHIYLTRSLPASSGVRLRLSRFTVRGGARPERLAAEKVLLEFGAPALVHAMTTVLPDTDGTLWVSVGDLRDASKVIPSAVNAMELGTPTGKLLRITPSGAGVRSNPYYDPRRPRSWRSRTYAHGFRSPFRFSLDPTTGAPIVGDVGWRTWEEINLVRPGANYKWPCWEGDARTPGYATLARCRGVPNTSPLWRYRHGSGPLQGNSVTGGIVYTGISYPAAYRGAYFFGDYTAGKIWTMRIGPSGKLSQAPKEPAFASGVGGPVKFAPAANGDIVFADIVSGSLRRLSYSPGNATPVAAASTRTNPKTRTVTFDAGSSVDYDGDTLAYEWNFGDGATDSGRVVSHTYSAAGQTFRARLTVTDALGASSTTRIRVAPSNQTPRLRLTVPARKRFAVGQRVRVTAIAKDAEDGGLRVRWTSALVHCSETATCHVHPGEGSAGRVWRASFTDHLDTHMRITATARDSAGVRVTKSYDARPRLRRLRLVSNRPAALQIRAGAATRTAMVTQGARVEVVAAKVATGGVARFRGWSDGVKRRLRTVEIGSRDITLKARYRTPDR
jgi:glucose/arabinose dehydrogenase